MALTSNERILGQVMEVSRKKPRSPVRAGESWQMSRFYLHTELFRE